MEATAEDVYLRITERIIKGKATRPPKVAFLRVNVASLPGRVVDTAMPAFPLRSVEITEEMTKAPCGLGVTVKIPPNRRAGTVIARCIPPTRDLGRARGRNGGLLGDMGSMDRQKTRKNDFALPKS